MKIKIFLTLFLINIFIVPTTIFAQVGDMGFFGGISQGRRLPKTTDLIIGIEEEETVFPYKEMVFLGGEPKEFEGLIEIEHEDLDFESGDSGKYTESYKIYSSSSTSEEVQIERDISFTVNYRVTDTQIIKDYRVDKWNEEITTEDGTFEIDDEQSFFELSIIEDLTPAVTYYKGNISKKAVYTSGGESDENSATTESISGDIYGYDSLYSTIETHRLNGYVTAPDWQMQYQVRPSVSVTKTLEYGTNEPDLISFAGNYREIISNESGLKYNIYAKPNFMYNVADEGGTTIDSYNTFEQLIAPDLNSLQGHFAEYDIKKLFAMEILDGNPNYFKPSQAITRAQYITMLVKAINLDTSKYENTKKGKNSDVINIVFPDIREERSDYKYIMAAYDKRIAVGRENGHYFPDSPITREEAIVILLRTIGLETLGLDPTPVTTFVDDANISSWAKKEIYAAQRIGLIRGDEEGKINPKVYISKAEAAALVNRLLEYMRNEMIDDYGQNIVHFAN